MFHVKHPYIWRARRAGRRGALAIARGATRARRAGKLRGAATPGARPRARGAAGAAGAQGAYRGRRRGLFGLRPSRSSDSVFLGNSLTDGCEWGELFDNRHIRNRGISSDRACERAERLDPSGEGQPKRLFLRIGINDLAGGAAPGEGVADIARVIDRFQTDSRWTRIFVQSILPVNGRDFDAYRNHYAHADRIVPTNEPLKALCEEKGVTYIDVWSALADGEGLLDKRYTNDGVHLVGEGYLVWRDVLKPYVK